MTGDRDRGLGLPDESKADVEVSYNSSQIEHFIIEARMMYAY